MSDSSTARLRRRMLRPFRGHSQSFRAQLSRLLRANATGYAVTLVAAPILSRIYSPAAFGAFGLFLAFLSLTGGLGGMRYEAGILSARDRGEARELAMLAMLSAILLGAITAVAFGAIILLDLFDAGGLPAWSSAALLLSIVFAVGYSTFRYILYFLGDAAAVARGVISQSVGRAVAQIGLGALGAAAGGLILGETIGRAVGVGSVGVAARAVFVRPLPSLRALVDTARRHYRYPLYSLPSSLSDAAVGFLPLPAIAALYGLHAAGLYAFVQRIVALPVGVVGRAVADAFHAELATAARGTTRDASPLFMRTFLSLAAASTVLALGLIIGGLTLFGPVLGEEWTEGGIVLAIVAPATAAKIAVTPLGRTVFVLGGQRQKFWYDVVALTLVVASIAVAAVLDIGFLGFLALLTFSQLVARTAYFIVLRRMVRHWDAGGPAAP